MLIFCTTWLGVGLSLKNVEQTSSKKEVIDIMCFVKGNNFTVHNFFKRPGDFGCILAHYVPDYKKTMRENGHFETIPFNRFSVGGTKINKNH